MMAVKEMVTRPGSGGESAYIFAMNIFTVPCCSLAPACYWRRGTQKCTQVDTWPIAQCTGQG